MFTLDEANALLPRLREILEEMQAKQRELAGLRDELEALSRAASGNGHLVGKELSDKRGEAEALAQRINDLLAELNGFGCELKGLDQGLVDFPAERDGRTVYLCWQLGEASVAYWHDLEAGFAGRQPL